MSLFCASRAIPDCVPLKGDKWRPAEESKIIELLGKGLSWREISEELPGRSEDSCCRHYYIMLKRSGSDRRADKIVTLYDRHKAQMWEPIANKMALPWRTVEKIYWQSHEERTTIRKTMRRNKEKSPSRTASLTELTPLLLALHGVTETPTLLR